MSIKRKKVYKQYLPNGWIPLISSDEVPNNTVKHLKLLDNYLAISQIENNYIVFKPTCPKCQSYLFFDHIPPYCLCDEIHHFVNFKIIKDFNKSSPDFKNG